MELDELKQVWAAQGALLERDLAIDERLLREVMLRKVRMALVPYVLGRGLEVAAGIAFLVLAVAPVLAAHRAEPRYIIVGGALAVFMTGLAAFSAYLVASVLRLDYGGPVTAIQRDVQHIRVAEYRALKWALLGGVLVWLPAALVFFEALSGIHAVARADLAWLSANLLFGLVVIVLGQGLSKKYVERPDLGPWARRLLDAVSGRALQSAAGHLAELKRFEREEPLEL